jgi:hypothetical protein
LVAEGRPPSCTDSVFPHRRHAWLNYLTPVVLQMTFTKRRYAKGLVFIIDNRLQLAIDILSVTLFNKIVTCLGG